MRKVPPSTIVREEIERPFAASVEPGTNILSNLAESGIRYRPAGPRAE